MSLPTFVCVPGSSHQPRIFDRIKYTLALHGYTVLPIALPSNGARPAIYDFTEDVRAIREQVAMLVNTGEDVIVVLHGYAGVPGSEALWGLGKAERAQRGFRGGVLRIVFIMSILAKEGFQASERGDISFMYPWTQCDLEAGTVTVDPNCAASVFYNDMSPQEAQYWTAQLVPQSIGVYWSKTTYAAWRYIPSTYVLSGQDQTVTLPYAEVVLAAAQASRPNMIDKVERCEEGGHCIMLSKVHWTCEMLRRAAGEDVAAVAALER